MAGGWDHYVEADQGTSRSSGDDQDSMPELESIFDTNVPPEEEPAPQPSHAARVEDADQEDEEEGQQRGSQPPLAATRAILQHVDSDDENDEHDLLGQIRTTSNVRSSQRQPSQPVVASQSSSATTQPATSSADEEFQSAERLQRWLLTTGLTDVQTTPANTESLRLYAERLRMLPNKQQDWIVRMVKQRAGEVVERRVREAMAS
jgi:hypothetical protein